MSPEGKKELFGRHFGFMLIRPVSANRILSDFGYVVKGVILNDPRQILLLLQFVLGSAIFSLIMTGLDNRLTGVGLEFTRNSKRHRYSPTKCINHKLSEFIAPSSGEK